MHGENLKLISDLFYARRRQEAQNVIK